MADADRERRIFRFFVAGVIAVVFLQKLCLPGNIEVAFPIEVAGLMLLFATIGVSFNVTRVLLYSLFCLLAVSSQLLQGHPFSFPSLMMALGVYFPFCVEYKVSAETYRRCLRFFLNVMLVIVVIVIIEDAVQFAIGSKYWVNLDNIIPSELQFKNFAYIRAMAWKSAYLKPNGIFFVEVSVLSQFLALAFVIELRYFQRPWLLVLFLGTLLITFAGTGLLLLLACAPFMVLRLSPRMAVAMLVLGAMIAVIAIQTGWYTTITSRFAEFDTYGRSGNSRFVLPWVQLVEFAKSPSAAFIGTGAGTLPQLHAEVWWPITKASVEYGFATGLALYLFLIVSMFQGAHDKVVSLGFLIFYSFLNGSFIVPYVSVTCVLFCTLMRIRSEEEEGSRAGAFVPAPRPFGAAMAPRAGRA